MYDDIYALLLIYGFSVLEHALQQMGAEGTIATKATSSEAVQGVSQACPLPTERFSQLSRRQECP